MMDEAGEDGEAYYGAYLTQIYSLFARLQVRFLDCGRGNVLRQIGLNRLWRTVFFRRLAARDPPKNAIYVGSLIISSI